MTDAHQRLIDEIKALNTGRGIRGSRIDLGDELRNVLQLEPEADDELVRRTVLEAWRNGADRMARDLAEAFLVVSGVSYGEPRVTKRISHAAQRRGVSDGTIRNLYSKAVQQLAGWLSSRTGDFDPALTGWYPIDFTYIADFTSAQPTFTAHRKIRVTAPRLAEVSDTIAFMGAIQGAPDYRCLLGAQVQAVEQPYENHWRYRLKLPSPLTAGDTWDFSVSARAPDRDSFEPIVGFLPQRSTPRARMEVWFDQEDVDVPVWLLAGVPTFAITDPNPRPPLLRPDSHGKVVHRFRDLQPGFAYAIRWQWRLPAK